MRRREEVKGEDARGEGEKWREEVKMRSGSNGKRNRWEKGGM